ncbi:hypothetical protein HNR12_003022 [Streptomonospora nanhaiensis]|uniref:Transmembrane efflux protein n=1 Tax=Streptomonospora nanhaiensis TaxID=1323731 RepID=A0A853BPV2_9ACTN|nr:hypothetical protein [Streptomonospora nanhaiensis]
MAERRRLGRRFGWLWGAFAVSSFGTQFAFGAFPLVAITVLHAGPAEVSMLSAAALAVGAAVAVPLAPWVEFRRKRPVMIAMDLIRFAALLSVPAAYVLGVLSFAQLLVVAVVAATADIAFRAAHGAFLKWLVPPEELVAANARLESATWTATIAGPPLGGAVAGLLGPVATLAADAISYLLSAVGLRAVGGREPRPGAPDREPPKTAAPAEAATPARESRVPRMRAADLADGWRYVLADPVLRPLFLNTVPVNSLIMATAPLMSVLMLDDLGFAPLAVRPGVRPALCRRPDRRPPGPAARRPLRPPRRPRGVGDRPGVLAGGPGVRGSRHRRARAGRGGPTGPGHQHRGVQPGVGGVPPRPDPARTGGPRPHGLDGHRKGRRGRGDRRRRPARRRHRHPHRRGGGGPAPAGDPAPAPLPA